MRIALVILALGSFCWAAFGMVELLQTTRAGATVFQQISARVDVGLSLLILTTAIGFMAVVDKLAAPLQTVDTAAGLDGKKPVAEHAGVPIYKFGDRFVAQRGDRRVWSGQLDGVKAQIDQM